VKARKAEMVRDRVFLEEALEALERSRAAIKKFRKAERVKTNPVMKKASKAFRGQLRATCEEANGHLATWTSHVEDGPTVTSKGGRS
jgi:hypothetical protein